MLSHDNTRSNIFNSFFVNSEEYKNWKNKPENINSSAFFCVNFDPLLSIGPTLQQDEKQVVTFKSLENGLSEEGSIIAFADPCTLENHPGWPLRNLLLLLLKYSPNRLRDGILLLSFRQQISVGKGDLPNKITAANSLLFRVRYLPDETYEPQDTDPNKYSLTSVFRGKLRLATIRVA